MSFEIDPAVQMPGDVNNLVKSVFVQTSILKIHVSYWK